MSTIKTTITLATTTLFPNPANSTISSTEQVNLNADFTTLIIPISGSKIAYGPTLSGDPSNTVYIYAHAVATNTSNVDIYITDTNSVEILAMTIRPGDFVWFPLAVYGANVQVRLVNLDGANTARIDCFFGERG